MDFFGHAYYRTGRTFTRLIGRWPYQEQWESRICSFVIIILWIIQFFGQVLALINYSDDTEIILELLMPCMLVLAMGIKYVNIAVNVEKMVNLLGHLEENWNIYTMEIERRILNEYAHIGQVVINGYSILVYIAAAIFMAEPLIPKWINYILQSNQTVVSKYPVPIHWYIVDMEDNFIPIWFFETICVVAIISITVANDSMFIVFLQHACGLFAIVGLQLENLPKKNRLKENLGFGAKFRTMDDTEYDYYVRCIKNHKHALKFANRLEEMYVWCFGGVIALNMPIISVLGVQVATQANTIQEIIKLCLAMIVLTFHLFFDCYLSQKLTDSSTSIQQHIGYSEWYGLSSKTRRLVTTVTLRSQVPCRLTAGKLVLLSMETFGVIIKTSISYFTMMVSMR